MNMMPDVGYACMRDPEITGMANYVACADANLRSPNACEPVAYACEHEVCTSGHGECCARW